jgi:hypothetical protein
MVEGLEPQRITFLSFTIKARGVCLQKKRSFVIAHHSGRPRPSLGVVRLRIPSRTLGGEMTETNQSHLAVNEIWRWGILGFRIGDGMDVTSPPGGVRQI